MSKYEVRQDTERGEVIYCIRRMIGPLNSFADLLYIANDLKITIQRARKLVLKYSGIIYNDGTIFYFKEETQAQDFLNQLESIQVMNRLAQ